MLFSGFSFIASVTGFYCSVFSLIAFCLFRNNIPHIKEKRKGTFDHNVKSAFVILLYDDPTHSRGAFWSG